MLKRRQVLGSLYMTPETVTQSLSLFLTVHTEDQYSRNSHRHTRFALFFHSLAMIACIREEYINEDERQRYLEQIAANQTYIRRYVTPESASQESTLIGLSDGSPPAPSTQVPG